MFNRIRRDRQARTRNTSVKLGFDMLDRRELMTAIVYNPIGSAQPTTQLYTFRVTNPYPTTQTIDLAIHQLGSGNGTLNKTSVTLAPNAGTNVVFTPTSNSSYAQDTYITRSVSGSAFPFQTDYYSVVSVTLPTDIRNVDTPSGMPNRIPPRTNTSVTVGVSPDLSGTSESLVLTVTSQGNGRGTVQLNGYSQIQITGNTAVDLTGVNQTMASTPSRNYAGFLKLAIVTSPTNPAPLIQSVNGFSVSAIPVNFLQSFQNDYITSDQLGELVNVFWDSDSGVLADLDKVQLVEQFATQGTPSGSLSPVIFAGQSSIIPGTAGFGTDTHSINRAYITGNGQLTQYQLYTFSDARTGPATTYYTITDSGYEIDFIVLLDPNGTNWDLTTSKFGKTVTVSGYSSNAGSPITTPMTNTLQN